MGWTRTMVEPWLVDLMTSYNEESYSGREAYTAQVHLPGKVFADLVSVSYTHLTLPTNREV